MVCKIYIFFLYQPTIPTIPLVPFSVLPRPFVFFFVCVFTLVPNRSPSKVVEFCSLCLFPGHFSERTPLETTIVERNP